MSPPTPREIRLRVIVGIGLAAIVTVLFLPPIPQDPAYHNFADRRRLLGIPNVLNVLSNAPFVLVGVLGWLFLLREGRARPDGPLTEPWERFTSLALFAGVGLTGFGSAYYHLAPDNRTLFWDRLPMTIVFMSLFAIVIAERISLSAGRRLFPLLLAAGIGSVVYWRQGEVHAVGDLRFYGLVQFFPLVAIPLMLLLFPPRYTRAADLIVALGWYVLAKIFEFLDARIFAWGGLVSGHTLKHLTSAVAMYWIVRMLKRRRPVEPRGTPARSGSPRESRR